VEFLAVQSEELSEHEYDIRLPVIAGAGQLHPEHEGK
jgi:hypothetical protein